MALDHPRDALPPGYRLGDYEILRVLGRGGFGITYAARGIGRRGEMVAIKELFPSGMAVRGSGGEVFPAHDADRQDLDEVVVMFCREAEVICSIRHPNLVRGMECLETNRTGYLVMAYVSGRNLHENLRTHGGDFQVTPQSVAHLCRGILSALEALHTRGIFHCDIKPDNIFLGVGFEPILIDLGSACHAQQAATGGAVTYSQHYSAIEQIEPRYGPVGPWTDIYQFAAVLYRCLTGGKLPDSMDRASSSHDPYVPLSETGVVDPRFPEHFLKGVDAGLERFPGDRPKSVQEWRRQMNEGLNDIDPLVGKVPGRRPPSPAGRKRKRSTSSPGVEGSLQGQSKAIHEPERHGVSASPEINNPLTSGPRDPLATLGLFFLGILGILLFLFLAKGCG